MSTPFLGQVIVFGFSYAPKGFALCNGQMLPINQNQALFSLLGTQFGGDGRTTFGLPNLQGASPLGAGTATGGPTYTVGQTGGETNHTLVATEIPAHFHRLAASTAAATTGSTINAYPTTDTNASPFMASASNPVHQLSANNTGGQPHANQSPLLVLSYCIALQGIFPSRN